MRDDQDLSAESKRLHTTEDTIVAAETVALAELCRRCYVNRLELIDAETTDSVDSDMGDVHFLVSFLSCSPLEHYDRYFTFLESLELLLGRTVFLVEARALRNPYFAEQVRATKRLCYAA